jgi:hypothetical protein
VQRGGYIYGFVSRGDTRAIKDASKSIRNAQEDIQRYGLEQRAEVERKAANAALQEAEKQLRSRRDLEQRHFKKQLENLEAALATGQITMDEAHRKIKAVLDKYGVEGEIAGKDLGAGFARGLRESMELVMAEYKKIRNVWLAITAARRKAFGITPGVNTAAAASASIEASRTAGAGQFPYYGVSTTPAGLVTPPGSAVTIQNMWVTSPAMAELVASTIARKVTRR